MQIADAGLTNAKGVESIMVIDLDRVPLIVAGKLCERLVHQARIAVVLSLPAGAPSTAGQLPSVTKRSQLSSTPATYEPVSDRLGRSTPRGTILGFVKAADRNECDGHSDSTKETRIGHLLFWTTGREESGVCSSTRN